MPSPNLTTQIPLEDFFKNPDKSGFVLSPNGEYLAFLKPWQRRMNIHIQKPGETEAVRITAATERDIPGFLWCGNQRIVYTQDAKGDENYRLFAVDLDGKNHKDLTPYDQVQARIIDRLDEDATEILVALNNRDPQVHDLYRIDVVTGAIRLVAQNPGNIADWLADHDGQVRLAVTTDGVNTSILYRERESESFHPIATNSFRENLSPLLFTFDNRYVYMASNLGRDKTAVVKYDPASGRELEVVYAHPEVDVAYLLSSKHRKTITGVSFVTWKHEYHFFDETRRERQRDLERRLPGCEINLTSMSKDETKFIVRTSSDKSLGAYYFYDTVLSSLSKLSDVSPWLDETQLADMRPITYTARDGLTIHGYLTLPRGVTPQNLPVVVNPHGGPWYRDVWGYNREVQFLANRGYAVLQTNYRGSTGYGRKFWEISFKQWGLTMQDDISDGVAWLVAQGIADAKRIAIYGGSYGGYAVLAGLAFTPNLYACGVDYVGVSNLLTFMKSIPPYWQPFLEMMYAMVGHPEQELALLTAASPVFHTDQIRSPLLIAQGANDPRVNKSESEQIVAALKNKGVEVEYLFKENEGHGFHNEENRFDFYRAMETFLAKHLAPTS